MLESLVGVGGVFRTLNVGVEDGAAVLGVLANQGTKGAQAGTALNTVLTRMQQQSGESFKGMQKLGLSMFDAQGNARNVIDVFEDMYNVTKNMTDEERNLAFTMIGGTRGYKALTKIMSGFEDTAADGTPIIKSLAAAYRDADGALENFYDIKTDTMQGAMTRLQRLYEDMQISIGETLAPHVNELVAHLAEKMPEITDVLVNTFERIAPIVSGVFDAIINNADKLVDWAGRFVAVFTGLKIGAGAIKGISSISSLAVNLAKIKELRGGVPILQGVLGTLLKVSPAAKGAGGAITGFLANSISLAVPAAAAVGGVALAVKGVWFAYDKLYESQFNWSNSLAEQAGKVQELSSEYMALAGYRKELEGLELVINNPQSSEEQIQQAQSRIEEIANLLNEQYSLDIEVNSENLAQAAQDAREVVEALNMVKRDETEDAVTDYIKELRGDAGKYRKSMGQLEEKQAELDALENRHSALNHAADLAKTYRDGFAETGGAKEYAEAMREVAAALDSEGLFGEIADKILSVSKPEDIQNKEDVYAFANVLEELNERESTEYENIQTQVENLKKITGDVEDTAQTVSTALSNMLVEDILNGDALGVQSNIGQFEEMGKILVKAGADTRQVATDFAAAKQGFTDFDEAVKAGAAGAMADDFVEFSHAIGESADNTAVGAAIIANGFDTIEKAASAGDEAVNNVLNDLFSKGSTEGLFEGMDTGGVLAKMEEIAHAVGLLPEEKHIGINADGNFEIINEAQEAVKTLEDVNGVDVTLNANGDISFIDRVTGEIETIENMGAVDIEINAKGDGVNLLNEAEEVLTTLDTQAQINVDGSFDGQEEVEAAVGAQNQLDDKSVQLIAEGSFPGRADIEAAVSLQNQLADKTVTYTVKYVQEGTPPASNAQGDMNWRGGLTYLNDQNVADPREVIEYNNQRYYYEGRNVLADVPKGATIYTAAQSQGFIDGSHRDGLESVPFDGYVAELHKGERVLTARQAKSADDYADELSGKDKGNDGGYGMSGYSMTFSPNITITGNADEKVVMNAMKMTQKELKKMMDGIMRDERRKSFSVK